MPPVTLSPQEMGLILLRGLAEFMSESSRSQDIETIHKALGESDLNHTARVYDEFQYLRMFAIEIRSQVAFGNTPHLYQSVMNSFFDFLAQAEMNGVVKQRILQTYRERKAAYRAAIIATSGSKDQLLIGIGGTFVMLCGMEGHLSLAAASTIVFGSMQKFVDVLIKDYNVRLGADSQLTMFCMQCGKPMEQNWVACPLCGKKYEQAAPIAPEYRRPAVEAWHPNKYQWWVIWAALVLAFWAFLSSAGNNNEGVVAGCFVIAVGALLVWKISHRKST